MKEQFDYIVVGAGSAGCVLAGRLAQGSSCSVLLLEAGGGDRSLHIQVPALLLTGIDKFNWRYQAEPDPSRGGAVDIWPAGKVLGGGSSINGMMYVRGNAADYEGWAAQGCTGWDYDSVLGAFRSVENYEGPPSRFRGRGGPQNVARFNVPHRLTDAFIAAAQARGLSFNPDYNGERQDGVGHVQVSQRRGRRANTAGAFLAPARRRWNLTVRTGAVVERVVFENGRATGVEAKLGGRRVRLSARREVILAAGAIGSPKLLMLSGIGPAGNLAALGVPLVLDQPEVGRNLQEHPCVMMSVRVNTPTLNSDYHLLGMLRHGVDWLLRGKGYATAAVGAAQAFARLGGGRTWPDVQIIFSPFGYAPDEASGEYKIAPFPAVSIIPCLMDPAARGEVRLASADPEARR